MKVIKCPIDMYKEDHNGSSIDVRKVDMVHQGNSEKRRRKMKRMSKVVVKKVKTIQSRFLWGSEVGNKTICWISWKIFVVRKVLESWGSRTLTHLMKFS